MSNRPQHFNLTFKPIGHSALLIEWPQQIEETILNDILNLQSRIEHELKDIIVETINAYNSLTLIYKHEVVSRDQLEDEIKKIYAVKSQAVTQQKKIWYIPVCYDKEFGIDLEEIAQLKKCDPNEIIKLHSSIEYLIHFIGFLPGFLYLGGLPESIHVPRKSTPRIQIKKGAVAIGGKQTGIYPSESPGGWNIIGNSPLNFFSPNQNPPCFAKAGDLLKFYSIKKSEHQQIATEVENGSFKIEYEIR